MLDLEINVAGEGTERVVRLGGTCDIASAPKLKETLVSLRPPDVRSVVIDVTELEFVDSTGLGLMLGALRRQREGGGELKIAGAQGAVLRVLEVTDLDKVIPLYPDVAAAQAG